MAGAAAGLSVTIQLAECCHLRLQSRLGPKGRPHRQPPQRRAAHVARAGLGLTPDTTATHLVWAGHMIGMHTCSWCRRPLACHCRCHPGHDSDGVCGHSHVGAVKLCTRGPPGAPSARCCLRGACPRPATAAAQTTRLPHRHRPGCCLVAAAILLLLLLLLFPPVLGVSCVCGRESMWQQG